MLRALAQTRYTRQTRYTAPHATDALHTPDALHRAARDRRATRDRRYDETLGSIVARRAGRPLRYIAGAPILTSSSMTESRVKVAGSRRDFLVGSAATLALGCHKTETTSSPAGKLVVGGLPVTCNLTLPIACSARLLAKDAQGNLLKQFEYSKYSGWPELKESLMSGRVQAAYMLAPLVMDLTTKKIPVKIVALGHRSGAVIMVRKDSPYRKFKDLVGKRVAIPSRFAVDLLFLRKMLKAEDMTIDQVELMEMPPPDMPAALYAKAVDAYCTGEPFGAAAELAGYAVPLKMTRDEWRNYVCCVLTVRDELIRDEPKVVQELVNQILGAGQWLDESPRNREKATEIASGKNFFNQDRNILKFVMEHPADRVTYGDLRMIKEEFDELMHLSMEAGTLKAPVPYEKYVDDSFAKKAIAAKVLL
jgi:NitT/TauT family transport system substrate-binding protein